LFTSSTSIGRLKCRKYACNKELNPIVEDIFKRYSWPGNVRELENVIERAINLARRDVISENELSYDIFSEKVKQFGKTEGEISNRNLSPVQSLEYRLILEAIEEYKGNLNKVTNALGIPRRTLYRRLEKYGIDPDKYRN